MKRRIDWCKSGSAMGAKGVWKYEDTSRADEKIRLNKRVAS